MENSNLDFLPKSTESLSMRSEVKPEPFCTRKDAAVVPADDEVEPEVVVVAEGR